MGKPILLVLTDNFDDMMFVSSQVILEEHGHDIIICAKENGIAKGKNSSVMTVALSEALEQKEDYAGIILIEGSDFSDWNYLMNLLDEFHSQKKIIGFSVSTKPLFEKIGIEINRIDTEIILEDNLIYLQDVSKAETFGHKFHEIISL